MEYARKIESGRKKAANKLNVKHKEIKATKGKTPTPVRLKEKFSFVNVKGKKREFVRKFAYDRALAKNKAEREKTPTPKAKKKFIFKKVRIVSMRDSFRMRRLWLRTRLRGLRRTSTGGLSLT